MAGELGRREALRYPPFADLIRIVFLGRGRRRGARGGRLRRRRAAPRARARAREVLGPAPLFRLRGRERFQLVVKTRRRERRDRRGAARPSSAPRATARTADVAFSVDVDPQ